MKLSNARSHDSKFDKIAVKVNQPKQVKSTKNQKILNFEKNNFYRPNQNSTFFGKRAKLHIFLSFHSKFYDVKEIMEKWTFLDKKTKIWCLICEYRLAANSFRDHMKAFHQQQGFTDHGCAKNCQSNFLSRVQRLNWMVQNERSTINII